MKKRTITLVVALLFLSICGYAQFTAGNLVVVKTKYNKSNSTEEVVLVEYSTSGTRGDSVVLPTTQSLPDRRFVLDGEEAAEGTLTISADGRYIVLAGYDTTTGISNVAGTNCNRVIARIDKNKVISTSTNFNGNASNQAYYNQAISGATTKDGTAYWASGNGDGGSGGINYVVHGADNDTGFHVTQVNQNTHFTCIFSGQLYYSTDEGTEGLYRVGTNSPTTAGNTVTLLGGSTNEAFGFILFDRDATVPGPDLMYISKQSNSGKINKYSYDGTTWTARGSIQGVNASASGLVGSVNTSGQIELYFTWGVGRSNPDGNEIRMVKDTADHNANFAASTITTIVTADGDTWFRGLAPAPATTTASNNTHSGGISGTTNIGTGTYGAIVLDSGANVTLTGNIEVTDSIVVNGGAVLSLGAFTISAPTGVISSFILSDSATINTSNTNGITNYSTSGAITTQNRIYSKNAHYTYSGTSGQTLGDALPDTVNNFTINNTSGTMQTANTMTVNGNLYINSGFTLNSNNNDLNLGGNLSGSGTLSTGTGKLLMNGSSAQTISNEPTIEDLELSNSNGATITTGAGNALNITGALTHTTGTLTTNGNLNLKASSATSYGQIAGTGAGDVSGTLTAEYIIEGPGKWRHICSPLWGATLAELDGDITLNFGTPSYSYTSVWNFDETKTGGAGAWQPATGTSQSMDNTAFAIYLWDEPLPDTVTISGTYTKGDYTSPSHTRTGSVTDSTGYHLVPLPWPSGYNHNSTITNLQSNTLYIYEGGTLRDWNGSTGSITSGIIPPFHGAFGEISTNATTLTLPSANRVISTANFLDKSGQLDNYVMMHIEDEKGTWDEARVYSSAQAENGFDFWDSKKMNHIENVPTLYTVVEGKKSGIQQFNNIPQQGLAIPTGFKSSTEGTYTLTFETDRIEAGIDVVLEDTKTKTLHPLQKGKYSFTHSAQNAENRFILRYTRKSGSTSVEDVVENNTLFIGSSSSTITLQSTTSGTATVQVIDLLGREITPAQEIDFTQNPLQTITVNVPATGYYIVRVSGDNINKAEKVFLTK